MRKWIMVWLLPAVSLFWNPPGAEAQYRYFGRPGSGYYGSGSGYYGGYGVSPASYGYGSGIAPAAYGTGTGYSLYGYSPYGYSYMPEIPYIWVLDTTAAPRMRSTLWPAVAVDAVTPATYIEGKAATATIELKLPVADAEVYFDGVKTRETGLIREFVTPPLEAGLYTYELRICWKTDSGLQEKKRSVSFRAGDRLRLEITAELLPAPTRKN